MIEIEKNPALEDILQLRFLLLRQDLGSAANCKMPDDLKEGSFHLAAKHSELPGFLGIASFHLAPFAQSPQLKSYRLRGMATVPKYFRQGIGRSLLQEGLKECKQRGAQCLWFNARKGALDFYKSLGFEIQSGEFDIDPIGPHFIMSKKID